MVVKTSSELILKKIFFLKKCDLENEYFILKNKLCLIAIY